MAAPVDPFKALEARRQALAGGAPAQQQMRAQKAPAPGADTLLVLLSRLGLSLADFGGFLIRLTQSPIWQGAFVDFTLEIGKNEATVAHGLGRAHRGAIVLLTTPPDPRSAQRGLYVMPPADDKHVTFWSVTVTIAPNRGRAWVF